MSESDRGVRGHFGLYFSIFFMYFISMIRIPKLRQKKIRTAPGASPGTLVLGLGSKKPIIRVTSYSADTLEERVVKDPQELHGYLGRADAVTWIEVRGLGDELILRELGQIFNIHPLALEDIVHTPQRPKSEAFGHHHFVIARMVMLKSRDDIEAGQVSIFLGRNYVLTFMEDIPDCLDPVRDRIRRKSCNHQGLGADYLFYSILDAIIDHYFPVLEDYGEYLEQLEQQTVFKPVPQTLARIHTAKRELLDLRRVIWPQRDTINQLVRDESPLISNEVRVFMRDCYDHSVQIMDMVETYRDVTSGLHDVYLSSISNRTNEIMKVLTIISTIFIPLTFIAGVYGMNFDSESSPWNMPELKMRYGYLATLAVMLFIGVLLMGYFWKKGWIFAMRVPEEEL